MLIFEASLSWLRSSTSNNKSMMSYKNRIVSDYKIMLGKPVIKGTRITVELILRKLSQGATTADVLQMYPHLQESVG
jgi:uncharacterized protein (DUF433 family)